MHTPQPDHASHVHEPLHMRVRVSEPEPHTPQLWLSISGAPGLQPLSPVHAPKGGHGSHAQPALQVRVRAWLPDEHRPHDSVPISTVPGAHSPWPEQMPSFTQTPDSHS